MQNAVVCRAHSSEMTANITPKLPRRQCVKLAGFLSAFTILSTPLVAFADSESAQLFSNSCAGCHTGGGNIIRRDATLKLEDLTKNNLVDPDELFKIIYSGKASMPGFGEECAPKGACTFGRRLTDDQVKGLAAYVLEQAKNDWTSSE